MSAPIPLTIAGRDGTRAVVIDPPLLLAPMEGVTDPVFRNHVLPLGGVGAACTEFIRISVSAIPARVVRRNLGAISPEQPVAVQFMAAEELHVGASVRAAEAAGATWIDLNFGCPAPVVFNKCAGSALLAKPQVMAGIVRTAVAATTCPVSVKMRVGITDQSHLRECLLRCADAGAAMITLHARLRCQSYSMPATWAWIAEAKEILLAHGHRLPLIGNGSVEEPADAARMRRETGCDGVMIGRAALADPWIFRQIAGGPAACRDEAVLFALAYGDSIAQLRGARGSLCKLKQLLRYYRAGGLFAGREEDRRTLLRSQSLDVLYDFFAARRAGTADDLITSGLEQRQGA